MSDLEKRGRIFITGDLKFAHKTQVTGSFSFGDWNNNIKTFQNEMHRRGYFPAGTGQYGPKTLAMVKRLQHLNGLVPNGYIGPNTWRLAWIGRYR